MNEPYRSPELLKQSQMELDWSLPKATSVGHMRGFYTGMNGTACQAHLIHIGVGQESPSHSYSGEHVILQLEGEVEFLIAGQHYRLSGYDMLFIPADVAYVYRNVSRVDALFASFVGKYEEWPPEGTYFD